MERELPSINIEGTDFLVDINKVELREKENPVNTISIYEMRDVVQIPVILTTQFQFKVTT